MTHVAHHTLPSDPRERVKAIFPALPHYAMTPEAIERINQLLIDRGSSNSQTRQSAEAHLDALQRLHDTLVTALNDQEELLWDGAAQRGKDILAALMAPK